MREKISTLEISILLSILVLGLVITFLPASTLAADNTAEPPEIRDIGKDDNLVNVWGDNVTISFQVHDENGREDIKSVEIFIYNDSGGLENYENLTGTGDNISPYDKEYSYVYNPENDFQLGQADVEIKAVDNEGNDNIVERNNFFEVTDADASVTTEDADNITDNSADLHASIDYGGYDKVEAKFFYMKEGGTWSNTSWENVTAQTYENKITGLESYENYDFRASVRLTNNSDGASQYDNGNELSFKTKTDNKPSVETKNENNVDLSSATLRGELLSPNWDNADVWFQWKENTPGGSWENTDRQTLTKSDNFSADITGLTSDTTYVFRAVASNPAGENVADNKYFTTLKENATVTTQNATNTYGENATLRATIDYGDYDNVDIIFFYRQKNTTSWDNTGWENEYTSENYENTITGLTVGKTYQFYPEIRFGPSGNYTDNGTIEEFTSKTETEPSVVTKDAENVDTTTATLRGELLSPNWDNADVWFQWKENTPGGSWENTDRQTLTKSDNFSADITGLTSDTTYVFRAVASNPAGENVADNKYFTTLKENASVTTQSATDIKDGEATLNADISYGDYSTVDVIFYYKAETQSDWENTGWKTGYTSDNYSYTLTGLPIERVYEFYARIRFSGNIYDNGSILTFNTGGVDIRTTYPTHIEVNPSAEEDRYVIVEVANNYQNKELRDVVIRAQRDESDPFRVFRDNYKSIGTIQADSASQENFTYIPVNSGEKHLKFTISYRIYQNNQFVMYSEREIDVKILVTGTEYENAIDLQVSSQTPPPEWIFNGETYKARIVVHNQRPTSVSGIRLIAENARDIGVGTLQPNGTSTVTLRVNPENYEVGTVNEIELRAAHELGVSPPLNLKFQVRPESSPVGVFLVRTNSPIYQGQTLEFSVVVAAAGDSEVEDLVIKSKDENVIPEGYWLGEEMKNLAQQKVSTEQVQEAIGFQSLLGGAAPSGSETEEEQKDRAIVGRKLYFEAKNLKRGEDPLSFEVTYELGDNVITRLFEVDYKIQHTPELLLIQSDPVSAVEGSEATITLEIANEMSTKVEAVRVLPPENIEITPRPSYWIGPMKPDEFLPVEFKLKTDGLKDGENLTFRPVYRVQDEKVVGSPLKVPIEIKESKEAPIKYYAGASAIVILVIFLLYWRRR